MVWSHLVSPVHMRYSTKPVCAPLCIVPDSPSCRHKLTHNAIMWLLSPLWLKNWHTVIIDFIIAVWFCDYYHLYRCWIWLRLISSLKVYACLKVTGSCSGQIVLKCWVQNIMYFGLELNQSLNIEFVGFRCSAVRCDERLLLYKCRDSG